MKNSITTLPKVNNTLWGRVRLALTIMTLFAMASGAMAQDDEGVSNVNFPPSDTEAKNWTVSKNDNGNIDLTYNGNRRVLDVNAVRFIDLGIIVDGKRIKWATTNVGAKNPWDYGDYYAWGETETKDPFFDEHWSDYTLYENSSFTKYNATDKINTLQSDDDIATVTFGNNCVMPTPAEWAALHTNCEWKWINSYKGTSVNGYAVFKKKAAGSYSIDSDPHIFLPAGGSYINGNINKKGSDGWYWSSSLFNEKKYETASELHINSSTIDHNEESRRFYGLSIRPIMRKNAYINLDKREASVFPGKTITLKATTDPANENVEWKSDDATIATVADGVVTGVKPGTTTITATYNGQDAVCIVTVLVPPEKITLSGASYANPYVWGTENVASKKFTATVTPSNADDKSVTWSSSNTNIITVDQSGNVKIIAPNETSGILDVTITATSNYDNSIKASYTIHLDNYVDLGTGEDANNGEYWKTTKESNSYTYANAESTLGIKNIPSKYDYDRLLSRCSIDGDKIKNKNKSGAYINCDKGDYWTNTKSDFSNISNYSFKHQSNSTKIGEVMVISALAVRCVRRFGAIKVKEIRLKGSFDDPNIPYIWGKDESSIQISCTVLPTFADNTNVTWSSNNSIATVDGNGKVTIVAPNESNKNATITITATAKDGSGAKGTFSFYVANYVDLGTAAYWYTINDQGTTTFTIAEAIEAYPHYTDDTKKTYSDKHLPDMQDDIEIMTKGTYKDNYTWTYNANTCTVKNKLTGVYINFPLIQCGSKKESQEPWYAYWSWDNYLANWYWGLEFKHNNTLWNPPNSGHLPNGDRFPVRLVKEKR